MNKRKRKTMKQFSKRVIRVMAILWFVVAFYSMGIITYQVIKTPEYVNLEGLLNFVGYPMSGGLLGYFIKAAIENRAKIKNNPKYQDQDEMTEEI